MKTTTLLNGLRGLLLGGSVVALGTVLFWDEVKAKSIIVDANIIHLFKRDEDAALKTGMAAIRGGDVEGGLQILEELACEIRHVRQGARLGHLRTVTLDALGARNLALGNHEAAMAWNEELLEFDPRDFPALVRRVKLCRYFGQDAEELAAAQEIYRVGAASGAGIAVYLDTMVRRGRAEEAAIALLRLGSEGPLWVPKTGWEFRWADGPKSPYKPAARFAIKPDPSTGLFQCSIKLPPGGHSVQKLRIDLPSTSHVTLSSLLIELIAEDGTRETCSLDDLSSAHDMAKSNSGALVAAGERDSYLVLHRTAAPAGPSGSPGVFKVVADVNIRFAAIPTLPAATAELFKREITSAQLALWSDQFGADLVNALEAQLDQ